MALLQVSGRPHAAGCGLGDYLDLGDTSQGPHIGETGVVQIPWGPGPGTLTWYPQLFLHTETPSVSEARDEPCSSEMPPRG